MEVILNKDIEKVGKCGSVVKVKDGFARNFLLPNGLAVPASSANLKKAQEVEKKKASKLESLKNEALALRDRVGAISLTIPVLVQEDEKLYSNINAQAVCSALKEEGIELEKNMVQLEKPIDALGIYEVPLKLHAEVSAILKVWIVKK
jgi:large subunit ribosomal protein L9